MPGATNVEELQRRRDALLGDLAAVGDLRPGSLVEMRRKCGKPLCHCADPTIPVILAGRSCAASAARP